MKQVCAGLWKGGVELQDQYGRAIDYLRISITDRCNLRCTYCMPEDGIKALQHHELLSYEEIIRLVHRFAVLGVRKIKLTGGEPLVRLGICDLIAQLKAIEGIEQVTITTNGVLLEQMAEPLIKAGINGINVSLDTADEKIFAAITRRDAFSKVIAGIEKVRALGYGNLKLNCVPIAELNQQQIIKLADYARDYPMAVRFIELMPIGLAKDYTAVSKEEIMDMLIDIYGEMTPYTGQLGNGPAEYYTLPGFQGKIGFIGAVHHKFCDKCNRIRLTSDGFLKLCLHQNKGIDIRTLLRDGISDEQLEQTLREVIAQKPDAHHFYEEEDRTDIDARRMFQVGG